MFFFVDGNQWNELVRLLGREGCKPMPALHTGETSAREVMCFMHLNILRHVYSILNVSCPNKVCWFPRK